MTDVLIMGFVVPVSLTVIIIVLLVQLYRIQVHKDRDQQELVNKIMSKDFKDYTEGTHLIDMGLAAQVKAKKKDPEPDKDLDEGWNPDEVPVI